MVRLRGGVARLGLMRAAGGVTIPVLIAATLLDAGTAAGADPRERAVLGTILAAGTLEVAREPGVWEPAQQGSPILEETELRTGSGKPALIALGKEGVIGLREQSYILVGKMSRQGIPVHLSSETELSFRMPATTTLYFLTDSAVVRGATTEPETAAAAGEAVAPEPGAPETGEPFAEGTVAWRGTETIVSVLTGSVHVRNRDGAEFVAVSGGQQAAVASAASPPQVLAAGEPPAEAERRGVAGLGFLGTRKGLLIAGATAVTVGAAVGGALAFDSGGGGGDSDGGRRPASPSRP